MRFRRGLRARVQRGPKGLPGVGRRDAWMDSRALVMLAGLLISGWGHLLVHEVRGAAAAWTRMDNRFPPELRTSPGLAGRTLLLAGAVLVLATALS